MKWPLSRWSVVFYQKWFPSRLWSVWDLRPVRELRADRARQPIISWVIFLCIWILFYLLYDLFGAKLFDKNIFLQFLIKRKNSLPVGFIILVTTTIYVASQRLAFCWSGNRHLSKPKCQSSSLFQPFRSCQPRHNWETWVSKSSSMSESEEEKIFKWSVQPEN